MSLDWSVEKVADKEWLWSGGCPMGPMSCTCGKAHLVMQAEAMIWQLLAVDVGRISKETAVEVFTRLEILRRFFPAEAPMHDGTGASIHITLRDVRRLVGLTTNIVTKPRKGWLRRIVGRFEKDVERSVKLDGEIEDRQEVGRAREPAPSRPVPIRTRVVAG